jgi:drug/metabolite transporter (DMT)-like permease
MAAIAYLAALGAALFWGLAPVSSKRGFAHGGDPVSVAIIVIATSAGIFWGGLALTQGPTALAPDLSAFGYGIFLFGGLIGTAVGRIGNYEGIDRVGASVNSAVIASNPLFATTLALAFLGEAVSIVQAVGVVVVVGGLVLLTFSKGGDVAGWQPHELLFPLLAALAYGTASVIRRFGLTTTPARPLEAVALNETAALFGLGVFAFWSGRHGLTSIPLRGYAYFLGAGVLSGTGLLLFFTGLDNGRVAIVTTLVATSTLFATAFSYVGLGGIERITREIVAGVALVVVGVGVITLA